MRVDGGIFRELRTDGLQLGFLLIARHRDTAPLPGGDALLEGRVIEHAAVPQDALELTFLCGCRPQLLLVRRAVRRLFAHV